MRSPGLEYKKGAKICHTIIHVRIVVQISIRAKYANVKI